MRLVNETQFPAMIVPWRQIGKTIGSALVVKATYDIADSGALAPSKEQMPLLGEMTRTDFGLLDGDVAPRKEGVDVCVLGSIRRRQPVTQATLRMTVGSHTSTLRVTGDRRWRRRPITGAMEATPPEPFLVMPLTYARAFGGAGSTEPLRAPWQDNPEGVGHFESAEDAEAKGLPNIEPGNGPFVSTWQDRPPVAGWAPYPVFWGLSAKEAVNLDLESDPPRVRGVRFRAFNNAHPSMILPELAATASVSIEGLTDRRISFNLPGAASRGHVRVGARTFAIVGKIDGVFVWPDRRRVVIVERAQVDYEYQRRVRREIVLKSAAAANS